MTIKDPYICDKFLVCDGGCYHIKPHSRMYSCVHVCRHGLHNESGLIMEGKCVKIETNQSGSIEPLRRSHDKRRKRTRNKKEPC